ncbi:MAG: acetate kinase, partial [Candidatus Omnitrophota bacterium]
MKYKAKTVNILVINCGSSSLKYKILKMPESVEIVQGEAERVGIKTQRVSLITHSVLGKKRTIEMQLPDHSSALKEALRLIAD